MSPLAIGGSYQTLDYIAGRNRNQQEAAARPARVRFFVNVTGSGEVRLEGLNFGALLMEEPTFSWGLICVDVVPPDGIPLATASVLTYQSNDNGIYTGADMGLRVESDFNIRLKFSLTFEGSTLRSTANSGMAVTSESAVVGTQSPTLFRR